MKKLELGQVVQTRAIAEASKEDTNFFGQVLVAFNKYQRNDWGDTSPEDAALNDAAVENGDDRVVAKYKTTKGNIFIITEWDRSATTILFANEY